MLPLPVSAALRAGLQDPDADVAAACLRALSAHAVPGGAEEQDLLRRCREAALGREPVLRRAAGELLATALLAARGRGAPLDRASCKALLVALPELGPGEGLGRLAALAGDDLLRRALVAGLRGSAWQLRPACAELLGRVLHLPGVEAALCQGLSDAQAAVRAACAEALAGGPAPRETPDPERPAAPPLSPATQRALLQALRDQHAVVRAQAAQALSRCTEDPAVRAALVEGTDDPSGRARRACLAALRPYADEPPVRERLERGLADPYWPAADLCARALRRPPPPPPPVPEASRPLLPFPRPLAGAPLPVAELLTGLQHDDPEVRLCCATWLGEHLDAPGVVPALRVALLEQEESDLYALLPAWMLGPAPAHGRAACARLLGGAASDTVARRALLEGLRDPHGEVREACAEALADAGRADVAEALLAAFRDGDEGLRRACARGLQPLAASPAVGALLIDGMSGEDPALREACARALRGAGGGPGALQAEEALLGGLADPAAAVRRACAEVLAGAEAALRRHLPRLRAGLRDGTPALVDGCARALGALGTVPADEVPLLKGALAIPGARGAALRALGGALPEAGVLTTLLEVLSGDEDAQARALCAELLTPLAGEARVCAALLRGLEDGDCYVRRACARALGTGEPTARRYLLGVLSDPGHPEAERAEAALGLQAADAPVLVQRLREDPSPAVRRACAEALGRLWSAGDGAGTSATPGGPGRGAMER